jgi:hypothetical protein
MQQLIATSSLDGPTPRRVNWVFARPVRFVKRELAHVVLCKVLSGSGYRLRPTSRIGEFTRHRSLLSKAGISLAEACRAGTRDGWRTTNGDIAFAARQARCIPDGVCKTSRGSDRPERALVAPLGQMNSPGREGSAKPNSLRNKRLRSNTRTRSKSCHAVNFGAQLWCYCNTLSILKWRHNTGRIAWLHVDAQGRGPCQDHR